MRNYPFGETRWQSGTDVSDFGFTDQRDESMKLMDFDARYYDSTIGRFISADTLVPGIPALSGGNSSEIEGIPSALNRYTYVGNNPMKNTDPDGHCYPLCTVAIGAVAGGIVGGGLYALNTASSGQDFDWSEAGVAIAGGVIAGGLIGTGVGAASVLGATGATMVVGAGAGMAGAEAGYLTNNIIAGNDFETIDFAIAGGVGAGAGAIAPLTATSVPGTMVLNATANALQYESTHYVNTGEFAIDQDLGWSLGTGLFAGVVVGPATSPGDITRIGGNSIGFVEKSFPSMVALGVREEATASFGRTVGGGIFANASCFVEEVCQ